MSEVGLEASSGFLEGRVMFAHWRVELWFGLLVGSAMSRDMCGSGGLFADGGAVSLPN